MNLSVGIVGLPNVGKSTLFNALLKKQQALAANYPFATIEPNVGVVAVPDGRLKKLAEITASELNGHLGRVIAFTELQPVTPEVALILPPIKPAMISFVDIAGLVKGASEGAGLGNKFLSHIREASVIAHVVRAFTDENIIREGSHDPESDYGVIQMELILADLATVKKAMDNRKLETGMKIVLRRIFDDLNAGIPVRDIKLSDEESSLAGELFLLSAKPEIVVLNVSEDEYSLVRNVEIIEKYMKLLQLPRDRFVVISAKIESELAGLSEEDQGDYLRALGFPNSGLERLIKKAYDRLGLISFLTAGDKEVRAWTIKKGTSARLAAGEIHTDFIKKFIKAEVVSYKDFVEVGGWTRARELGKAKQEGRDYVISDGDVVEYKIGS